MSNGQLPAKVPVTIGGCLQTEKWKNEVAKVLPQYLTPEMMLRVARSVASDPKFGQCSPESFLLALIKCARAGLVPDGRNAHLIPFGKEVQAIFDWKGMVAMAQRNGVQVTPKLVHKNDVFKVQEDDGSGCTKVVHEVDFTKARGEIIAVYSRAKTVKSNDVDYEFMTADEVESVRQNYSRAKDSLMWTKSWGEAAKKTVIRRHSKRWDLSPEDRAALMEDDDAPDFQQPTIPVVTSRPIFDEPKKLQPTEPPTDEPPPEAEAPQPDPDPEPEPEPTAPVQQPDLVKSNGSRYLKAVRTLCKASNFREGELMEYLASESVTDGSAGSLDELPESVLKVVHDSWSIVPDGGLSVVAALMARRPKKGASK